MSISTYLTTGSTTKPQLSRQYGTGTKTEIQINGTIIFLFKATELWLGRMERSGNEEIERGFILIGLAHFPSVFLTYISLTR